MKKLSKIVYEYIFVLRFTEASNCQETSHDKINLLLVGTTGSGKSSTGNSILGERVFETDSGTTTVTRLIQSATAEYDGYVFTVVDTPSVGELKSSHEKVMEIFKASNPNGFDAIALVVPFGKMFTEEDSETVAFLREVFGEKAIRHHTILVVTRGDLFDLEETEEPDFNKWCSRQTGGFHRLLEECGRRVVLFDNMSKDKDKMRMQVNRLIKLIKENRNFYSLGDFEEVQLQRSRRLECANGRNMLSAELEIVLREDPPNLESLENLRGKTRIWINRAMDYAKKDPTLIDMLREITELSNTITRAIKTIRPDKIVPSMDEYY